jgi:hypothetical protein
MKGKIMSPFKRLYNRFRYNTYLVCPMDDCVIFIGSLRECEDAIDTLPGDLYLVCKRKHLTPGMKETLSFFPSYA